MGLGSGYFTIGRFKGAPIRLHWSVLLLAVYFGRSSVASWVALILLILVHELGHAIVVRYFKHKVVGITVTFIGGTCEYYGPVTAAETAMIAWGGVWAQGLLYCLVQLWLAGNPPVARFEWALIRTFTDTNVFLMIINLLPFGPFDGARAWSLFPLLLKRAPLAPAEALRETPRGPYAPPITHLKVAPDRSEDRAEDDSPRPRPAPAKDRGFDKFLDDLESGRTKE